MIGYLGVMTECYQEICCCIDLPTFCFMSLTPNSVTAVSTIAVTQSEYGVEAASDRLKATAYLRQMSDMLLPSSTVRDC